MLEFRLLGTLEIRDDGADVPIAGQRQRALLALLLLRANNVVPTETLVDLLWGERPPRTAVTSLQNAVAHLRKALGPSLLLTEPRGYRLNADPAQIDLGRFEQLVARSARAEPADRVRLLREALGLWRGPPLADLAYEPWAVEEVERLERARLSAVESLMDAELELGGDAELVPELETLLRVNPLRERLRGQLMLALYRSGRQADALQAYHEGRRLLADELGIDPSPELRRLYESILRQERALVPSTTTLEDHYGEVVRALVSGRLVPVLGTEIGGAPAAEDLASLLGRRFECPPEHLRGLPYVSQYVSARNGVGPLWDELHDAFVREASLGAVQAWLASLPPLLRARGVPQLLVVTAGFDTSIERAFADGGEELDVVTYLAGGRDRGRFLHVRPDGSSVVVHEPNTYVALSLDQRTVLLRIHGRVDSTPEREHESFVVREDDHIDYLSATDAPGTLPVTLAARLRRSHLLFLGYPVHDWSLRVFLRRVWGQDRLAYRSWAVHSGADSVDRDLWRERGVDVFEVDPAEYVRELGRRTAEAAATGSAA